MRLASPARHIHQSHAAPRDPSSVGESRLRRPGWIYSVPHKNAKVGASEGTPGARLRDQRGNRRLGGLCASITPRYQTATFRPVRPPILPAYVPVDRMPVWVAENGVRIGRRGDALRSSTWQSLCSTPWSWTRRSSRCAAISGCWPEVSEPLTSGPSYHPLSPWRSAAGLKLTRRRRRSPTRSLRKNLSLIHISEPTRR